MPVVTIITNAAAPLPAKAELAISVTNAFIEVLRTPKEHVHVLIQDGQFLSFGGDYTTPAAYITVHSSTRSIMEDARKALVDKIAPVLQLTLGLDTARTTTFFTDHPVENIAVGSQIIQFSSPRSPPATNTAGMFKVAV